MIAYIFAGVGGKAMSGELVVLPRGDSKLVSLGDWGGVRGQGGARGGG